MYVYMHTHTHTHLGYPIKQCITKSRNDSLLRLAVGCPHHCVGLATPSLPVGKDTSIVAFKGVLQDVFAQALIDIHLVCGGRGRGGAEALTRLTYMCTYVGSLLCLLNPIPDTRNCVA